MGLLGRPYDWKSVRKIHDRAEPFANLRSTQFDSRSLLTPGRAWSFFEGSAGTTDMTRNYNRVTTGSMTFTKRSLLKAASLSLYATGTGDLVYNIQIEIASDTSFIPDVLLFACSAGGPGAIAGNHTTPLDIIVEPGTMVFWSYQRAITAAAYWVTGQLVYVELPAEVITSV